MTKRLWSTCLQAALLAAIVAPLAMQPGYGFPFRKCKSGKCPAKVVEVFDESAKTLIWQVAHNPSLMNVDYLKYFIGRPENERFQSAQSHKHFIWYDAKRQPAYELLQDESAPGQVTDSTFIVHLKGMGLTFDKLDKFYGNCSRRFYDYYGRPNELFTFAADTYLSFASQPNTFRLDEAKIIYKGAPLPPPSATDMAAAQANLLARAHAAGNSKISDEELLPTLFAHVKCEPNDPEAHLQLAQALQRRAQIHAAIGEYKLALAMSGDNDDVRKQSLYALRSMHIIDDSSPEERRRNLEIVDNGQRLSVVGKEKKSHKKTDDGTN